MQHRFLRSAYSRADCSIDFALPIPSFLAPSLGCEFGNQQYHLQLSWSEHGCRARKQTIPITVLASSPRSVFSSSDAESSYVSGALADLTGRHPAIGVGDATWNLERRLTCAMQPYSLRLTSPNSTIGSEASLDLVFLAPPASTTLLMVAVKLVQTLTSTVKSTDEHGVYEVQQRSVCSKRKHRLFSIWNTRSGLREQHSPPTGIDRPHAWTEGQQAICAEARTRLSRHSVRRILRIYSLRL